MRRSKQSTQIIETLRTSYKIIVMEEKRASSLRKMMYDNNCLEQCLRLHLCQSGHPLPIEPQITTNPPTFKLPPIPEIQPHILDTGASKSLARSLSRLYYTRAIQLHDATVRRLHQIWQGLSVTSKLSHTESFRNVVDTISDAFLMQLRTWIADVVQCLVRRQDKERLNDKKAKPSFKNVRHSLEMLDFIISSFSGVHSLAGVSI